MKRSVTKKPKLTKWFDGSVKPVRDGVYQRKNHLGDIYYSMFKDGFWLLNKSFPLEAKVAFYFSGKQNLPWRGLAVKP